RRKPHWVRAQVQGGSGAQGSGGGGGGAAPLNYAELLRPENSAVLQEFIHHRKEELERLRSAHYGKPV
ncbi:MAG: hypothetical protein KIS92_26095, partial [Planctomycetota bacterium]|nr:hypothetical protein [Planctomycetota bacterium]